ncbi:NUDIX hydrolase [Clostridiisalibacter paucivorans]|uniref:NUDIX hydrolase n=1 Tax=Clostridiisalibacter paucivorans TaxID=408753 RepID=UPI00047D5ED5|nr:CoA pyrophosphatase [Clostridiisalibacter paucivorans]
MELENINKILNKRKECPMGINESFSVLLPLIDIDGELHLIYEIRAEHLETQPGEISFPGGMVEWGETHEEAAVRETEEELNISRKNIEIIGKTDFLITPFNIAIYPFVGVIKNVDLKDIRFSKCEVDDIFTVPLKFFLSEGPLEHFLYMEPKPEREFPYHMVQRGKAYDWRIGKYPVLFYEYNNYIIWGITARITRNFIDILKYSF